MNSHRHTAYKDSGLQWLGSFPEHWAVQPLWTLFRRVKRCGFQDEQLLSVYREYGVIPKASRYDNFNKASDDLSAYQLVEPGDLAINKMKAWQGSVAISEFRGIVSPAYFVFKAEHAEVSRYLHYLLRSAEYTAGYLSISKGIRPNQWDLEPQEHSRMPVLLPPVPEQDAIATFLDRETAKIDALVGEQTRLINLLKEKRHAFISHAVTKGLNPDAPMTDSGIEWVGKVPEHWEVVQVRRLITAFEQGYSPECFAYPAAPGEWGILKSGCVNRGIYRENENKALPPDIEARQECEVVTGDLLMSRASGSPELIGSVAIVKATQGRILMSDKIFRLRLEPGIRTEFAYWMFASDALRTQIVNAISGGDGMANNLPQSSIKAFKTVLPPVAEQEAIAAHLKEKVAKHDALAATAEAAITLLQERRTALISAAVTGQIDLRSAAQTRDAAE